MSTKYNNPTAHSVYSLEKNQRWHYVFFLLFWGVFTYALLHASITDSSQPFWVAILAGVFLLVWLAIVYSAITAFQKFRRFGKVPLHIDKHPVVLGQPTPIRLELKNAGMSRPQFEVNLICEEVTYVRGRDSEGRSTTREHAVTHWSDVQHSTGHAYNGGVRLDMELEIPIVQPATDMPESSILSSAKKIGREYYRWFIQVKCQLQNTEFSRSYPVTVQEPKGGVPKATPPPPPQPPSITKTEPVDEKKLKAVQTVTRVEMMRGKSPDQLWEHMTGLGMSTATILAGFSSVAALPGFQHASSLNQFIEQRQQDESSAIPESGFWDPLTHVISAEELDKEAEKHWQQVDKLIEDHGKAAKYGANAAKLTAMMQGTSIEKEYRKGELRARMEEYLENPGKFKRTLWALFSIPLLTTIIAVVFFDTVWPFLGAHRSGTNMAFLLLLPFGIPYIYIRWVYSIQTDMIKQEVADVNGWLYSPNRDRQRGKKFNRRFGNLFKQQGGSSATLEDEFWGHYQAARQPVHFWSGLFHYQVVSHSSSNNKRNVKHYTWTAFALPLNEAVKTTFMIRAHPKFLRWLQWSRTKVNVNTASSMFNRMFNVYRNGIEETDEISIMKVLSPAVQVRLIDLYNNEGEFAFLFDTHSIAFVFRGRLLKKMKTDFFSSVELDERDRTMIQDRLNHVLSIAGDILPFLR